MGVREKLDSFDRFNTGTTIFFLGAIGRVPIGEDYEFSMGDAHHITFPHHCTGHQG
jgi:hypothetical protein